MRRRLRILTTAVAALMLAAGFGGVERLFAPKVELWPRWQVHDAQSRRVIDHGAWESLLGRYIVPSEGGLNLFAYSKVGAADKAALKDYLGRLVGTAVSSYNRGEQLAYWINLYNALTAGVVLDHYPVDSIRDIDISPGLFADGPWGRKLVTVEGEALSLDDIEHRILRPIWRDPRIHYAVNCASIGCPNLQSRAYTAATVEGKLEEGARDYINSARGVFIDNGTVTVSKIYDWFHADFGGTDAAVLAHLLRYAAPALKRRLAAIGAIHEVAYDWRLNDVR